MELKKQEVRTRTIHPLPEVDPEFCLELCKLTSSEAAKIRDSFGLNTRHGASSVKEEKCLRAMAFATIKAVHGLTTDGGTPVDPESDDARALVYENTVEVDGEERNLWVYAMELYDKAEREERKN